MKKFFFISSAMVAGFVLAVLALFFPYPPSQAQTTVNGRIDGFDCVVAVSTGTSLAAVGGACTAANAGAQRAMYITDVEFGTSAAATTATDTFPTLYMGSGTNCATNPVILWQALTGANTTVVSTLSTPIKVPAGNDICWIMNVAGSKTVQVHGFYGPGK